MFHSKIVCAVDPLTKHAKIVLLSEEINVRVMGDKISRNSNFVTFSF